MKRALRAPLPPRRWIAALVVTGVALSMSMTHAIGQTADHAYGASPVVPALVLRPRPAGPPRVLLIGDSVLDQQGSAAAFLLRQHGVDARAVGIWGSGLLSIDQYDLAASLST